MPDPVLIPVLPAHRVWLNGMFWFAFCVAMLHGVNPGVAESKRTDDSGIKVEKRPAPQAEIAKKQPPAKKPALEALIDKPKEPDARIAITTGQAKRLRMARRMQRISIADSGTADALPISSREIQLVGLAEGVTTVHLWLEGDRERDPTVLTLLVHVQSK